MIVTNLQDIEGTGRDRSVAGGKVRSVRYVLREDGTGFSLSDVKVPAGADQTLHYKNHIETNLVLEGEGTVEEMATGTVHELKPGTCYTVFPTDRHRVRTRTAMRIISVFNPPVVGPETHDADGSYPLL